MSTQLSAFTPRIAYRVDGCPDPTIEQAVLDACIEFAERSGVLRYTAEPAATVAGEAEMTVDIPTDSRVVSIKKVWVDGQEIAPIPEEFIGSPSMLTSSNTGETISNGTPRWFVEVESGVIRLAPPPDKEYMVTVRASAKPSRAAAAVDTALFENWGEAVVDGALARLFRMPEKWSDPTKADYHLKRFETAIGSARIESVAGRTGGEVRVRPVGI